VIHTDENSWLVDDGINDPNLAGATIVTAMVHLVDADPSLAELATLRCGEIAQREYSGAPWRIAIHEWADSA
jgi:hypothetical protein